MSSFRRYGGLNFSGNNNITKSYISNSEQMNITNYSGQQNSKVVYANHIDMSGNSILHTGTIYFQDGTSMSSATGSGGQGAKGDKGDTGDSGIVTTVPLVDFGTVTVDANNIYIPINYPTNQTYNGAIPAPLPVIAGNVFELSVDTITTRYPILNTTTNTINTVNNGTAFNPYYVKPLSFYNGSYAYPGSGIPGSTNYTGLQGIVLSKSTETNLTPKLINFGTGDRYAIIYNTSTITGSITQGTVYGQYYDYASYSEETVKTFNWYSVSKPPGINGSKWTFGSSSYNYIQLNYTPPTDIQTDVTPNVSGINIINFKGNYTTTGDATNRYGGTQGETSSKVFDYPGETLYPDEQSNNTFSNLYPESTYYFGLFSKNDAIDSYSDNVYPNYGFNTENPINTGILQIDTNYSPSNYNVNTNFTNGNIFTTSFKSGTIYEVGNNNNTNNIQNLFFNENSIQTKNFRKFSVNYDTTSRGTNGQSKKLMDINTQIKNNSNTIIYGSTASFYGFSSNPDAIITSSPVGITYVNNPTTTDMYSSTNLQNYYLISSEFYEQFNPPDPANSLYSINLSQNWYNIDGTTTVLNKTASQNFYYDALTIIPSIGTSSYSFDSTTDTNMYKVSGINVIAERVTFNLSIKVTNLYNKFYISPVLNYHFSEGCNIDTDVLNLEHYDQNSNIFTLDSVTISNISAEFKNTQTLKVTANNLYGSTKLTTISISSSSIPAIPAIYDKPSYNFITNTTQNPTSIQEITAFGSPTVGLRVWSNIDTTPVNSVGYAVIPPPYKYTNNNNNYSYSLFPYQQSWSIVSITTSILTPLNASIDTSQEIQIYNGHYGTGTTTTDPSGENGYINYNTDYYNNSLIYSDVSRSNTSYRYTTFVWKIIPPSGTINFYKFTFNKISATSISSNSPYTLNNNQRFFLFYKTEQFDPVDDTTSSIWIDGNSTNGTRDNNGVANIDTSIDALNSNNYNNPPDNTVIRAAPSREYTINEGNLVAKVSAVAPSGTPKNIYIYCRFGNSMNYNITYESVTLSLLS